MDLSQRYKQNIENGWVLLIGVLFSFFAIFLEIEYVLSVDGVIEEGKAIIGFFIIALLIAELIAIFLVSNCFVAFLYTCWQQFFHAKWSDLPSRFSLNILSYRLFYTFASRLNIVVFGFLIGLFVQRKNLMDHMESPSDWHTVFWAYGSILQGMLIQFFIQSVIITIHYVIVYQLRKKYHVQTYVKHIKQQLNLLREQALHPMNLVLSFVVAPFIFFIGLLLTKIVGYTYTLNEITGLVLSFTLVVYTEVTLILTFMNRSKHKQKTKG